MTENEYDNLFRLLCKLKMEAPCMNGGCPSTQVCDYGFSGCYGDDCAIDIVRQEAESRYYDLQRKERKHEA